MLCVNILLLLKHNILYYKDIIQNLILCRLCGAWFTKIYACKCYCGVSLLRIHVHIDASSFARPFVHECLFCENAQCIMNERICC